MRVWGCQRTTTLMTTQQNFVLPLYWPLSHFWWFGLTHALISRRRLRRRFAPGCARRTSGSSAVLASAVSCSVRSAVFSMRITRPSMMDPSSPGPSSVITAWRSRPLLLRKSKVAYPSPASSAGGGRRDRPPCLTSSGQEFFVFFLARSGKSLGDETKWKPTTVREWMDGGKMMTAIFLFFLSSRGVSIRFVSILPSSTCNKKESVPTLQLKYTFLIFYARLTSRQSTPNAPHGLLGFSLPGSCRILSSSAVAWDQLNCSLSLSLKFRRKSICQSYSAGTLV